MYCPNCATQNSDGGRFCRACGTALEVVAQALDGRLVPKEELSDSETLQPGPAEAQFKRAKGMRGLVTGGILMVVSLLILLGPLPFIPHSFPWLVIWATFFGWMAVWGTVSVTLGIGHVMDSDRMMRQQKPLATVRRGNTTSELMGGDEEKKGLTDGSSSYDVSTPPSITETTTRHLDSSSE